MAPERGHPSPRSPRTPRTPRTPVTISPELTDIFGRDARPREHQQISLFVHNGRNFHVFVGKYSGADGSFILSGNRDHTPPKLLNLFEDQNDDVESILFYDTREDELGREYNEDELELTNLPVGTGSLIVSSALITRSLSRHRNKYYWTPHTHVRDLYRIAHYQPPIYVIGGKRIKSRKRKSKRRLMSHYIMNK